jgi:hypothetical protein
MVRAAGDFAEAYDQGDCLKSAAAVKGLAPRWSVDLHMDLFGETSLMSMPPNVDERNRTYPGRPQECVGVSPGSVPLDNYGEPGKYITLDGVLGAIRGTPLSLPSVWLLAEQAAKVR